MEQIIKNLEDLKSGIFKDEDAVNKLIDETIFLAEQQGLSAANAGYGEIAGQKLHELNMHETMTVYGGEHLTIKCMRVPGGFIYQYSEYHPSENEHLTTSTVFVPEPMQLEYSTSQEINIDKLFEE